MRILCNLTIAGVLLAGTCAARAVTYDMPADSPPPELSGSDAEAVVTSCSGCHSLDYIVTQPRHKGVQFWRDEVGKMVNVYKAPLAPADVEAVTAVLSARFG
jgi:hypothetical protein